MTLRMGTGVIFAILAVGWLAFLIPWLISRRQEEGVVEEPQDAFTTSRQIIKRGFSIDDHDEDLEVSTPLTRRSALNDVHASHRLAAKRRRNVVFVLLAATIGLGVAFGLSYLPWWAPVIPAGLLIAFLAVARVSVIALNKLLDDRVARINRGWENETINMVIPADLAEASNEFSIELSEPLEGAGSLWDPIPVTAPTYVSKPLVPRTVRTIDLSAPSQPVPSAVPVTAEDNSAAEDSGEIEATNVRDLPRAVGE